MKQSKPQPQAQIFQPAKQPLICSDCGGRDFWQEYAGGRYQCRQCNPQTQPERIPAREIVTMPAALADQADELRRGWDLIQNKRATAGLPAMPAITDQAQQPTKAKPLQALDKHKQIIDITHKLWRRGFVSYKEIEKICIKSVQGLDIPGFDWSEIDQEIRQIENQPKNQSITFYAEMGIEAARRYSRLGGGWRLYVIAKHLDKNGMGRIKRDDLQAFAFALGVTKPTFYRWMDQARRNDLFSDVQSQGGDWWLILPSAGSAAAAMDCPRISRKVSMPASALIGKGWKARINAAFMAMFNGKPIARETIQKTYNIAQSTQRYRDAAADITRVKCIAELGDYQIKTGKEIINRLAAAKREGLYNGEFIREGKIYRRLPNIYQYTNALRGGKGRARKANRIIKQQQQNGLLTMQQALSDDVATNAVRLYNMTEKQTKGTMQKIRLRGMKVQSVYQLSNPYSPIRGGVALFHTVTTGAA